MFLQAPMLFRLLIVLSVLLAPAEGAPIFIRNHLSRAQNRIIEENVTVPPKPSEDTVYRIVIPAAVILFVLAVICGAFAIIYCCLKKKKPMKDVESQYYADDFTESNTKLNGKHEDNITITTDDSPHGPGNEQRDVLRDNKISVPGPPDVGINIIPAEDEVTSSEGDQEVKRTVTNEAAPHGPEAENGDIFEETKSNMADPTDISITSSLDGNMVTSSDRKHEDDITITTDSPHGPGNEQRDVVRDNKISVPGPPDIGISISPDEDEVTSSDIDHEVKRTVTNEDVPHEPEAENGDIFEDTKINMAHPTEVVIPSDGEFDISCPSGDNTMPHKAGIVEVKESKINPDLNDYKQTPPSILKGRNQMKNEKTGKNVSSQESDDQYKYDSKSSQPGHQTRSKRGLKGIFTRRYPLHRPPQYQLHRPHRSLLSVIVHRLRSLVPSSHDHVNKYRRNHPYSLFIDEVDED